MEIVKEKSSQKRIEYLSRDKDNYIILKNSNYNSKDIDVGEYLTVLSWIELKNNYVNCLIKNFPYDINKENFIKYNGKKGINIAKYNNIIIPYIGSEVFRIETVKYSFARFHKGKQNVIINPYLEYLLTIDEKKPGEEVWEGFNILFASKKKDTYIFSERLSSIEEFLKLRYVATHNIQNIMDEFIRQEIFKKAVEYVDNHNVNWFLGINGKNVRVFPAYDFDFCSGIKYEEDKLTMADNGDYSLKSLIEQYKDLPWMKKYIQEIIQNFSMENVFEISNEETGIEVPEHLKQYYLEYYSKKKSEINNIYNELFQIKGEEELCV